MFAEVWNGNILLGGVDKVNEFADGVVNVTVFTLLATFDIWVPQRWVRIIRDHIMEA